MSAKKQGLQCRGCPPELTALPASVSALSERVRSVEALNGEVRGDVKKILESVQKIEIHLALVPTFDDLSPVKDRITSLEESRTTMKGAWWGIVGAASAVGGLAGMVSNLVSGWWNPK